MNDVPALATEATAAPIAAAKKASSRQIVKAAPKAGKPKAAARTAAKPAPKVAKPKAVKFSDKPVVKSVKPAKVKTKPAAKTPAVKPVAKPANVTAAPQATSPSNGHAKQKLVRDSFTMPSGDFGLIHTLKERTLTFRRPTKKSELLRAGLHALAALNDAKLRSVLEGLAPLKSGRPKKAD